MSNLIAGCPYCGTDLSVACDVDLGPALAARTGGTVMLPDGFVILGKAEQECSCGNPVAAVINDGRFAGFTKSIRLPLSGHAAGAVWLGETFVPLDFVYHVLAMTQAAVDKASGGQPAEDKPKGPPAPKRDPDPDGN